MPQNRILAIGDIHGHAAALESLLHTLDPQADDTIITLGDYVNRGPDSRAVLELLIKLKSSCRLISILGNHDEMMLEARDNEFALHQWLGCGGEETLLSYGRDAGIPEIPPRHWEFLASCVPYFEIETHFFVHANYDAHLLLEKQSGWTLRWLSLNDAWPKAHESGKVAVVGHTPQLDGHVLKKEYLIGIDTGCGFGGQLTAIDVSYGRILQVAENGKP